MLISFIQSVFPVLQLVGLVDFTSDQVAAIMLCIGNFITLLAFIFKAGQQSGVT